MTDTHRGRRATGSLIPPAFTASKVSSDCSLTCPACAM
jgi:hypothetical protein